MFHLHNSENFSPTAPTSSFLSGLHPVLLHLAAVAFRLIENGPAALIKVDVLPENKAIAWLGDPGAEMEMAQVDGTTPVLVVEYLPP